MVGASAVACYVSYASPLLSLSRDKCASVHDASLKRQCILFHARALISYRSRHRWYAALRSMRIMRMTLFMPVYYRHRLASAIVYEAVLNINEIYSLFISRYQEAAVIAKIPYIMRPESCTCIIWTWPLQSRTCCKGKVFFLCVCFTWTIQEKVLLRPSNKRPVWWSKSFACRDWSRRCMTKKFIPSLVCKAS